MTTAAVIDAALHGIWRDWAAGIISDTEVEQRRAALEAARPAPPPMARGCQPLSAAVPPIRRWKPRRYQRSPDREASRRRRRMLGARADMPPSLCLLYTEGERAVLTVIAGEVRNRGYCDLPVDAIAARAGVCRTTVHNARRTAVHLGHITWRERRIPGAKSKTNLIHIISAEWRTWLSRSGNRPGCKRLRAADRRQAVPPPRALNTPTFGRPGDMEEAMTMT